MTATERIYDNLHSLTYRISCNISHTNIQGSYSNNDLFKICLTSYIKDSILEIPIIFRHYIETVPNNRILDIKYPLFVTEILNVRTANTIFNHISVNYRRNDSIPRLIKVITSKGDIYYIGYGFIFNSNWELLFLCTTQYSNIKDSCINLDKFKIYIHPKVFGSTGLVEKGIIKTLIPAFIIPIQRYSLRSNVVSSLELESINTFLPEICIKKCNKYFVKSPVKPSINTFNKDNINKYLLNNIEDIKKEFK